MHAHARDPYVCAPVLAHASAGRHAKTGGQAGEGELSFTRPFPDGPAGEGKFDFGRPFLVDIGRAAVIADWLRASGYPRCTADVVTAELARPAGNGEVAAISLPAPVHRIPLPPADPELDS